MPAAVAVSRIGRGAGPPPSSTASSSASAAVAAGSASALASCAATRDVYRRPGPKRLIAPGNSVTSKPALVTSSSTGTEPASTLRTSTCRPAMWYGGKANSQLPGPPRRSWVADALAVRAAAGSRAPLGAPVVPDVPTTRATSSSIFSPTRRPARNVSSSGGTATSAGPRPSSTRSRAGISNRAAEPAGTPRARRTAMRGLHCQAGRGARLAASPWRPTGPGPARRLPVTAVRR